MAHGKMSAALFPLLLSSSSSPRDECMRGKGATPTGHSHMVLFHQSHGGFFYLQTQMIIVVLPHSFKGGGNPTT